MPKRLLALALLVLPVGMLAADELRTLGGKSLSGSLISLSDGGLVLDTKDGPVSTPMAQVLALDLAPAGPVPAGVKYSDVRLIDDSIVHCREIRFEGKDAHLTLLTGTQLKLPLAAIASLARNAEDAAVRKMFDGIVQKRVRRDRIVIGNAELSGILGDISGDGKSIEFKSDDADGKSIPVNLERVQGLIFYRPDGPAESPICKVYDQGGNVLSAAKIAYRDKAWQLTTTFGAPLSIKEGGIAKLDFNMGKLTYLSDLEPAKVIERSGIGLVVKYRRDANLDGEPIVIDKRYVKGLAMHAHTELEFDLGGKYKDLKGTLGIDVRTGVDSQPLVTIFCDGEKRFSETITAKAPRPVSLNVKDVGTLKIVVSSRNELDLHDHVCFADARVSQ